MNNNQQKTKFIEHFHKTLEAWEQNIQFQFKIHTYQKVKQWIDKK